MGDLQQPVVGMKSCFDFSELEDQHGWSAREWFLVRKAEVQISGTNMLIPMVKMGVEAREQVVEGKSLADKPVTRVDHPMVKYAEAFTKNFDLIAERRSVMFHLRELAKASVMAKFLLDSRAQLEESWFGVASGKEATCSLEVPQLWNERNHSQVQIKDGSVQEEFQMHKHGVYGGVRFGLEKFNLSASASPAAGLQASGMPRHRMGLGPLGIAPISQMSLASGSQLAPAGAALSGVSSLRSLRPPTRLGAAGIGFPLATAQGSGVIRTGDPRLQGVDLRLDQFDLSEAKRVSLEAQAGSWSGQVKSLDECVAVGSAFFACLDDSKKLFSGEDRTLLQKVFNPSLSDRRAEGDLFVPPDASQSYVQKLRSLVKEEEAVYQRRRQAFCEQDFAMGNPGTLFPHSWTSSFELSTSGCKAAHERHPQGALTPRPEYKIQGAILLEHLKASAPIFDKATEEGVHFRIYRLGNLEVRTTQNPKGAEDIDIVFSIRNQIPQAAAKGLQPANLEQQIITRAASYIERAFVAGVDASRLHCQHYLVLDTVSGNKIVTERLSDGQLSWVLDPEDLEERNSLAKLTRLEACSCGTSISEMKSFRKTLADASPLSSKHYVKAAFVCAAGKKLRVQPDQCLNDIRSVLPGCFE